MSAAAETGQVAILDATNSTQERRDKVRLKRWCTGHMPACRPDTVGPEVLTAWPVALLSMISMISAHVLFTCLSAAMLLIAV